MLKGYTNQEIVDGFINGKKSIIDYAYKILHPKVRSFVLCNSGSEADIQEVVQKTIQEFLLKCRYAPFFKEKLTNFDGYIFAISKNIWFKELRERKKRGIISIDRPDILKEIKLVESDNNSSEMDIDTKAEHEKDLFILGELQKLRDKCQKVIRYVKEGKPHSEIAILLQWKENYVKVALFRCRDQFSQKILKHPNYALLKETYSELRKLRTPKK